MVLTSPARLREITCGTLGWVVVVEVVVEVVVPSPQALVKIRDAETRIANRERMIDLFFI
jgi:hypothetical protein